VRLRVLHTIRTVYHTPATQSAYEARLMPQSDRDQTCLEFRLTVRPPTPVTATDLPSGRVHTFRLDAPHSEMMVFAESLVETRLQDPFARLPWTDEEEFALPEGLLQRYADYLAFTERVPDDPETDRIAHVARRQAGDGMASFLLTLTRMLHRVYILASTQAAPPALQPAFDQARDLRQDFLHLMLAVCRRQGIPARYVSGYFFPDGHRADIAVQVRAEGPEGRETIPLEGGTPPEASMHAWIECLLPDERWHGFDPIHNLLANDAYIKVHYGQDAADVAPLRGSYPGSLAATTEVSVRIQAE